MWIKDDFTQYGYNGKPDIWGKTIGENVPYITRLKELRMSRLEEKRLWENFKTSEKYICNYIFQMIIVDSVFI